jgi:DNA mismatch endonuclease, patch repair protein
MTDKITAERRSWNMSRIRSKNTKPELIVRTALHKMGYRFRLNGKVSKKIYDKGILPGKPDIVLSKYKTIIFVHGCYWHRHEGCKKTTTPKSSIKGVKFWKDKFAGNVKRDKKNQKHLNELGWKVQVIWECEVKKDFEKVKKRIKRLLQ